MAGQVGTGTERGAIGVLYPIAEGGTSAGPAPPQIAGAWSERNAQRRASQPYAFHTPPAKGVWAEAGRR
jgi:hypothetical protein